MTSSHPPRSWRPLLGIGVIGDAAFGVRAHHDERSIMLALRGSAEQASQQALGEVLRDLHQKAVEMRVAEVQVDMRELEFMASSCFKQFVTWLNDLQLSDASAQYRVRFVSDGSKYWQRRSLTALAAFAAELVHIETRG